jgi:hypothetical protein
MSSLKPKVGDNKRREGVVEEVAGGRYGRKEEEG